MGDKEVLHTLRGDKRKQVGCMNGLFQMFDHRYFIGQRRNGHTHKRLPPGQSNNGETELMNDKENSPKVVTKEKNSLSIELPRNSISSSSSSTAMPPLDCSKRVQTELSSCQSVISEPSSTPFLHKKQPDLFVQSPDIRDVVKDSMTREPRVVSIKRVAKDERIGPTMKHVDSPRPSPHEKPIQYERIYRNLKELKETTRFSCDGRESRYQMKSGMTIKELPRLSLDSSNSTKDRTSNKRTSSSVVARLMGLEALTPFVDESKTSKTNRCFYEESVVNSKLSRKEEELKHDCTSVSPRVHKTQRGVKVNHVFTRIPLETAPWKQERGGQGPRKPPFKSKKGPRQAKPGSLSIYDEIEKRLTEHEFESAGKDLRALKQILEAMQKTKNRLENEEHAFNNSNADDRLSQKVDQPVSPATTPKKVKHAEARRDMVRRSRLKDPNVRECSGTVSRKMQRSKNSIIGPSSDLSRPKKQPGMQRPPLGSTNKHPKAKTVDQRQDSSDTRNLSQQSETVSFQSNDSEVTSTEWSQEVNSPFQRKKNHRVSESTAKHDKHTMEQPSPVSVLDAFYTEDTPSPVKMKAISFNDDENVQFEEAQHPYSEFDKMKLEKIKNIVHQIELLNTNTDEDETGDQRYVEEILLASGCLRDLDGTAAIAQLHPTAGFINPELFHVLEKTKIRDKKFMRSKIRRKLVFDTVNDVLGDKLARFGPLGPHKGRTRNADTLLKELWSGIDGLQNKQEIGVPDEDDEVTDIINADVNKRSQDWDEYYHQVPDLVLDIERLIFKDLITEVVNDQVTSLHDWQVRPHCRRLFPM
ncbi:putative protein LONGIFOLIA [Helianthus annuus]|nr:putative protein LONGIFOLIA [Helianthus annuus]